MIIALSAGRAASRELRARIALDRDGVAAVLRAPREGIDEMLVLSTCHRTEVYAVASFDAVHAAAGMLPGLTTRDHTELSVLYDGDAVRHLFRVACGLDSLVVGEPQVLAQVRDSYRLAREAGTVGPVLTNVCSRAIALGRAVRRNTALSELALSIGALGARMLADRFGTLAGVRGAVVGSGIAATDVARALRDEGAELTVMGRRPERARRLARGVGAEVRSLGEMAAVLEESSFAVVAVGGGALIDTASVPARAERPLVLLDISVPPAVEVAGRDDVDVRTIEDLSAPRPPSLGAAVVEAESRVDEAVEVWERWVCARPAGRDAAAFRARVEQLVRREVAATLARIDVSAEESERIAEMANRITNKLLHGPTVALRRADPETRRAILALFEQEW